MTILSHHDAALLKLHLLSEGVTFDRAFLGQFARDDVWMEKRRVYDDSDERQLDRTLRIPQELYLNDIVVAVNYKHHSPWQLVYCDHSYRLLGRDGTDVEVAFPARPRFLAHVTADGTHCDQVANLYGGSSLAFFTPGTCYYFDDGQECKFCSLKPNRGGQQFFLPTLSPALASAVLEIALQTDAHLLKQIMLVGGNIPDYDQGFQTYLDIAAALDQQQASLPVEQRLETHIATMPPRDFGLFAFLHPLNARVSLNMEVFDEQRFEVICPGKAHLYGRKQLLQALKYAAQCLSGRVHSVLIVGLEPTESTIAGIEYLASIGVTPTVNVFHNDRGSHYEQYDRPSFEQLLEVAQALQKVYKDYHLIPYWKGCGRNALDFEAQQGWFE